MRIRTVRDDRRALEELKQVGPPDAARRHELEAAVALYAQEHNNARVPTASAGDRPDRAGSRLPRRLRP